MSITSVLKNETGIIGIDGSQNAENALEWYLKHFHKPTTKLYLLHCIEMSTMPTRDTWESQTKLCRQTADELSIKYTELMLKYNVQNAKFIQVTEKPGEAIINCVSENHGDFIVMGARGMSKIRRTLLGSVSNFVLNHASVPVLICSNQAV